MNRLLSLRNLAISASRLERVTGTLKYYDGTKKLGWITMGNEDDHGVHVRRE